MAEESKTPARGVSRWDPFEELDLFRGWDPMRRRARLGQLADVFGPTEGGAVVPAVDIAEDDERYVVTMEVPGASKDDVTVETHDNVLTVRGEKRSKRDETHEHARYVERRYGSFSRSFTLPSNASDDVKARFADGVLTVELPKVAEPKPRVVSIKS